MDSKQRRILERVFAAEIDDRLPWQPGRETPALKACIDAGYLQSLETTLPGKLPVVVKGWQLTHLGRMTYCASC